MYDKSHLTAVARKKIPAPTRWLLSRGFLNPAEEPILDYGCGKCHELNNLFFRADGYDPYYRKDGIRLYAYKTIICNFVLNVIPSRNERFDLCNHVQALLSPNGRAFLSVRTDMEKLKGWTKRGTWQGVVQPVGAIPFASGNGWAMYRMSKDAPLV
jgi:hypothetical protein